MFSDFPIHRLPVIVIVRERVMDRRKREVRIMLEKLFGSLSVQQRGDNNRSDRDTSTLDPWAASADGRIGHDVGMCYRRHGESLANLLLPCNPLLI